MTSNQEREIYRYYSQHGEDYLLWQFFEHKPRGFFIEVGAFDGIYLSNSWSFEQKGWKGLCVEPHPSFFSLCQRNRQGSTCLNVACVGDDGTETVSFKAEKSGVLSSIGCHGSYQQEVRERYESCGFPFEDIETITVKTATLNHILMEYFPAGAPIDFISIDVEGYEEGVLQGFDTERFQPRIIIVEANSKGEEERLRRILEEDRHYFLARKLDVNLLFARSAADRDKLRSIPINCFIEKQMHPLGPTYSYAPYVKGLMLTETINAQIDKLKGHLDKLKEQLDKRLQLLKQNGTNWIRCQREVERLSSHDYFLVQLKDLQERMEEVQLRHSPYLVYGTGPVARLLHLLYPASTLAFIDNEYAGNSFQDLPVISPQRAGEFAGNSVIVTTGEPDENLSKLLMEEVKIDSDRIIPLVQGGRRA